MEPPPRYSSPPKEGKNDKKPQLLVDVPTNNINAVAVHPDMISPQAIFDNNQSTPKASTSPSQIEFERITQLPTPIITNGSFNLSPVDNSPPIIVGKLRRKTSLSILQNRAISEYKPIDRQLYSDNIRSTDYHLIQEGGLGPPIGIPSSKESIGSKRISSNPIPIKTKTTPSPPPDHNSEIIAKYKDKVFHANGQDYKFVKVIGTGNFSHVVLAKNGDNQIAVKIISVPTKSKNQVKNFKYFVKRELNILHSLDHPNIVKLVDYDINLTINRQEIEDDLDTESELEPDDSEIIENANDMDIDTDYDALRVNNDQLIYINYCKGGNLYEFSSSNYKIYNATSAYWKVVSKIVKELIGSVSYLHSNNIIHRDIKLENVLLNYTIDELIMNPQLQHITCLTDFGLAKRLKRENQLLSTRCGSSDYISPEILMGVKYNGELTDAWSIGVLIYCLLEDRLPFDLPPYNYLMNSGISPSVIKRKMAKNTAAHRIAMIDWGWYVINDMMSNEVDQEIQSVIMNLKAIVDLVLVRKDKRVRVCELMGMDVYEKL